MNPLLSPHHHTGYVDSHIHLDRYADDDAAALLERASQAGVGAFLTIGVDRASSQHAVAMAVRFGAQYGVNAAVGRPTTRQENAGLRATIASTALPLDRLLIETDTYPLPGRATEPADVVTVVAEVAALKDLPIEQVAHQTTTTFMRLFRLMA